MSTHKHIDKICCVVLAFTLLVTIIFMNGEALGIQGAEAVMGYEERLFDTSGVHRIDIIMDDWDSFVENCSDEAYVTCTVVIDGEAYKNVAIRAKGNTSLTQVRSYGSNRYSFKIEFDHYDSTKNYYGLDKLCLNNIIQDNTYMKDYLTYQMMGYFGVDAPLCCYAYITVNGDDWGLYLAVESIEEAFLQRNYGSSYGELYKPDSSDMGGGRGNGENFRIDAMEEIADGKDRATEEIADGKDRATEEIADGKDRATEEIADGKDRATEEIADGKDRAMGEITDGKDRATEEIADGKDKIMGEMAGGGDGGVGRSMGSDDVSLIYTDDDYDSYSNIFDNAKTDISDNDKERFIASLKKLNENEEIESIVNIDEVIRYFVVHNFVLNFDSYTGSMIHNYYLYEENGQFSMIPWDYNLAFGGFQSASDASSLVNYPIDTPVSGGTIESRPMLSWIFASEEYTEQYHQYFSEFISQYFDSGYFEHMIDSVQELIAPYVEMDPTKFCTYEAFEEGIAALKEFCLLRAESVNGQLDGTIASTSDGQEQDRSSFIDAGNLEISAMGSMENSEGLERPGDQDSSSGVPERPDDQDSSSGVSERPGDQERDEGDTDQQNDISESPSFDGKMPDNLQGDGFENRSGIREDKDVSEITAGNESNTWMLLGVSVGILLIGLAVAFNFKR